ncbi:MAG: MerR family transcriptional regulator [Rhodospirillales bacterium]|nr:MerR family transcriptional regulator [Rhodospirillales bacterium]
MAIGAAQQPSNRRTGKSAAAFRTISEVAAELDLPQHVLRFWESKFSEIKPLKRGGGRRYYRPEDLVVLRHIKGLLYDDGYTIKGAQKFLRSGGGDDTPEPEKPSDTKAAPTPAPSTQQGMDAATKDALRDVLAELEAIKKLI